MKEEHSNVGEGPLRCINIAQILQIPKEEFIAEDGPPVKVEAKQPLERFSILHKLPGEEDTNDPEPSSTINLPEEAVLFDKYEVTLPEGEQPPRPESRSLLEDDLETQNVDISDTFSESPGGSQSDPKISLKEANNSITVTEDEFETGLPQRRGGLLKAKPAELEQLD